MSILLSVLLLLATTVRTENGRFAIYQDGTRIGTEEFSIRSRGEGYLAEGRTRIAVGDQNFDLRSRMELDEQLRPTFYEYQSMGNAIRLRIDQPISELEYTVDGEIRPIDVRFPEDGAIVDDNFFHHFLILLYREGVAGTSVPAFVPQQMTIGPMSIQNTGEGTYELETANVKAVATTDADGRLLRLTVPEANVVVER